MRRALVFMALALVTVVPFGHAQSGQLMNQLPLLISVPADYDTIGEALANAKAQWQPIRIEVDARESPFYEGNMLVNWDRLKGISIVSVHGRVEVRLPSRGGYLIFRSTERNQSGSAVESLEFRESGTTIEGFDFVGSKHTDWFTINCSSCTFRYNRFIGLNVFFTTPDLYLFNNHFAPSPTDFVHWYPDPVLAFCLDESFVLAQNNFIQRELVWYNYPACDYSITNFD